MTQDLTKQVQALLPPGESVASIEKLFGEASYREYFRVQVTPENSYILMKIPEGKQSVSEEITNYQGPKNELPFLNMARYLSRHRIPAPRIIATNLDHGLISLQDLGDRNLESLFANSNPTMNLFFYRQAIDLLLKFQKVGEDFRDEDCIAFQRSFDFDLLFWEFKHFIEYGIEDRFSLKIPEEERREIMELGRKLVEPITQIPFGLTHRDFQSRNLMLYGYEFYLIDFQDALLGPPHYDLVALLRDSYVTLPYPTVEKLVDDYLKGRKKVGLPELNREEFFKIFHLITLQRKLKDTGRFQFINSVKKNPNFLPHVPHSLAYVKKAFEELSEHSKLRDKIAFYVPELK